MKAITLISCITLMVEIAGSALAQSSIDEMVKNWERAKAYPQEYLDAMPEEKYSYKPTDEIRSFAEQMLRLTDTDYGFVAAATGVESPVSDLEKTITDKSKANITKLTMDGYDFVISHLKKMDPTILPEHIKLFGRFDLSRQAVIDKAFEHQTHQRGQATIYLRLAGVTPPREKLF